MSSTRSTDIKGARATTCSCREQVHSCAGVARVLDSSRFRGQHLLGSLCQLIDSHLLHLLPLGSCPRVWKVRRSFSIGLHWNLLVAGGRQGGRWSGTQPPRAEARRRRTQVIYIYMGPTCQSMRVAASWLWAVARESLRKHRRCFKG